MTDDSQPTETEQTIAAAKRGAIRAITVRDDGAWHPTVSREESAELFRNSMFRSDRLSNQQWRNTDNEIVIY